MAKGPGSQAGSRLTPR